METQLLSLDSPWHDAQAPPLPPMKTAGLVTGDVPKDYQDPEQKLPPLPQPFRMIDRLIRTLVEEALELTRDEKTDDDDEIGGVGHSIMIDEVPDVSSVQCTSDGLFIFVGSSQGQIKTFNALRGAPAVGTIEVEEPVAEMTLGSNGRVLGVVTPTKVRVYLVTKTPPFLKLFCQTDSEEATSVNFSPDGEVISVVLGSGQIDAYSISPAPEVNDEEEEPEDAETAEEAEAAAAAAAAANQDNNDSDKMGKDPVKVLSVKGRAKGKPEVFMCMQPKGREVGELQKSQCSHVGVSYIGSSVISKYRLGSEPVSEDTPAVRPVDLRTPSAVTASIVDSTTAMLCTGMQSGAIVVWNNIFNTQHFSLSKHTGAVKGVAFLEHQSPVKLISSGVDNSFKIHDLKSGTLLHSFSNKHCSAAKVFATPIPLVLPFSTNDMLHVMNIETNSVPASIKVPTTENKCEVLPCLTDHTVSELLPVIRKETIPPPPKEEDDEGGEEEEAKPETKTVVYFYRLIDLFSAGFPALAKSQYAPFIQISAREVWLQASGLKPETAAPVSDRYLRDAKIMAKQPGTANTPAKPGMISSPRAGTAGRVVSPRSARQTAGSPRSMRQASPRTSIVRTPGTGAGGARASPGTPGTVNIESMMGSPMAGALGAGPKSAKTQRSRRASTAGSDASSAHLTLANLNPAPDPTLAEKSFFDPVEVIMTEIRNRADEKIARKLNRQKRAEELLASLQ